MSNYSVFGTGQVVAPVSGTTAHFIPFTQWLDTASVWQVRAVVEVQGLTTNCQITPAYQMTNTPDNTNTSSAALPSWTAPINSASNNMNFGAFDDMTTVMNFTANQVVRFGINVATNPAGRGEGAWVGLLIEVIAP